MPRKSLLLLWTLLLLSCSGAQLAFPAARPPQKVLLVTSLDGFRMARQLPWFLGFRRSYYRKYNHSLENVFRAFFKNRGFELQVAHYADQHDLAAYLHSPEYAAVYLVSHEAVLSTPAPGMTSGGLYDYAGYEVNPILSEIHPNVKVFALVGCISLPLITKLNNQFRTAGTNPNLKFWGFSKKVDAKAALKGVLKASLPHLTQATSKPVGCPLRQGYPFLFKRNCRAATGGPSVRVEAGGKVIATFPRCGAGDVQNENGFIESNGADSTAAQLKFQITSGANAFGPQKASDLGELEIFRSGQLVGENWKIFAKSDGTAFGTTGHVYRHVGPLPHALETQNYHSYQGCDDSAP